MEFFCDSKFLNFPISTYAKPKRFTFYVDGAPVYELMIPYDAVRTEFENSINVSRFNGKTVRLECEDDLEIRVKKTDVRETGGGKYRPAFHFTAGHGWLNDPNGLIYYNGKYRMFFQHNPAAGVWNNMHWGSAESDDLVHWTEGDIALYPDADGTMYSGSAVIDRDNLTGLKASCGEDSDDVLLLYYTCAGGNSALSKDKNFTQCLAYSTDGGKTFQKYEKNPLIDFVVKNTARDPQVIRLPDGSYAMALYLEGNNFALFRSNDLLNWQLWQKLSLPDAECPNFYPLAVDGDPKNVKWVFSGASGRYLIGSVDASGFHPECAPQTLHYCDRTAVSLGHAYAAQCWTNIPDGRTVRISFMCAMPAGEPYGSCMTFPQEMSLKTVHGALRLCAEPIREIETIYGARKTSTCGEPIQVTSPGCDLRLSVPEGHSFELSLWGISITYDAASEKLKCLDGEARVRAENGVLTLRALFDTLSIEIYAEKGSVYFGMTRPQDANLGKVIVKTDDPAAQQKVLLDVIECR